MHRRAAALLLGLAGCSSGEGERGTDAGLAAEEDASPDAARDGDAAAEADAGQTPVPLTELVRVGGGLLRGVSATATIEFKGIPYAAPPVGPRRWRPPEPSASWEGERDARDFGPVCTQVPLGTRDVIGDEDCLTLNVWAPRDQKEAPLPVMFWIHGGDNVIGSGSEGSYDGAILAEQAHAVVVTINYRLAAFGWLAHPAFGDENVHGASGNYGLLDQVAALEWVHANIAVFGGDPDRVLVFGQSAGASNTCALVASPLGAGLFSRAIMHSLNCDVLEPAVVASTTAEAVHALRCDDAADPAGCLREATTEEVALVPGGGIGGSASSDYYEVIDGWALTEDPVMTIRAGRHNAVPMILGTTEDEYSQIIELMMDDPDLRDREYEDLVRSWYPDDPGHAEEVLALYALDRYRTGREALVAILSDTLMNCPTRAIARAAIAGQTAPVFRYLYRHVYDNAPTLIRYGAAHGYDIDFVFHNWSASFYEPSPDEIALADLVLGYWSRFAATGDPRGEGALDWPLYDGTDPHLEIEAPLGTGAGWRNAECDFWEGEKN